MYRALVIFPVGVHVFANGSYNSALARTWVLLLPPITNTFPLCKTDAVWPKRGVCIEPVTDQPSDKYYTVMFLIQIISLRLAV
jgi:hypothetical protein